MSGTERGAVTWSESETRCCVCMRLFPTSEQVERHADVECDSDPCWCWSLCWAEWGGDCIYPDDLSDDLAVFTALRAWQEHAAALRTEREEAVRLLRDIVHGPEGHEAIDAGRAFLARTDTGGRE